MVWISAVNFGLPEVFPIAQPLSCVQRILAFMTKIFLSLRRMTRLSAIVPLAAIVLNASAASAQPPLGVASSFAVLGGPAVTCTDNTAPNTITDVTGNVGVVLGTGFTNTGCTISGALHLGDAAAAAAYAAFLSAYNNFAPLNKPSTCDPFHTLTGPLNGLVLSPGVYCVDAVAKAGLLTLNGNANDVWIFLVNGFLAGTGFNVQMMNGSTGQPCNVYWWVKDYATMTNSNFLGTILAGAYITVTGPGTFDGRALATAAVTLTDPKVTACQATGDGFPPSVDKCEANHDKDGDDHDKDKGKDNDKDHKDKDKDKDKDHKDNDHESKDTKRG